MSETSQLYFIYFLIFMLGASLASFISVYVERSSIWGRSMCSDCLKQLNYFELVPIFSYLFLKGKCRHCKAKIPSKLFVGEIILGAWFLASFFFFQNSPEATIFFILSCIFGSIFYLLALQDLEDMNVGASFVYLLFALGILGALGQYYFTGNSYELFVPLLVVSPFWIIFFINKNLIGEADPYIYSALALFYGTQFTLSLFLYSVWIGCAYGIFYLLVVHKRIERGVRIPFLPIIFLSTLLILIFNYHIIQIQDILFTYENF